MANSERFNLVFTGDWSNFERQTDAAFSHVIQGLQKISEEQARLNARQRQLTAGGTPARGSPEAAELRSVREQLRALKAERKIPDTVPARRKQLQDQAYYDRLQLSNVGVAGQAAAARQLRQTSERAVATRTLANDQLYAEASAELATQRKRLAASEANALARNQAYLDATAEAVIARRRLAARESLAQQEFFLGGAQGQLGGKNAFAAKILNEEAQAAVNADILKAQAQVRLNKNIEKAAGGMEGYSTTIAQGTVAQETLNAQIKTATERERATNPAYVRAQAASIKAEQDRRVAIENQVRVLNGQTVSERGPSRFQQLQAFIANRSGSTQQPRSPLEFQNLGQFLTSKAVTTAGFAVSGAAFYTAFSGIKQVTAEAKTLQTNLTLIREQLRQAGSESQFPAIRGQILETARATGIAGSEIAYLALQLRGAFSQEIARNGIGFFNEQLDQFVKIARVTGLPLNEVTDSLTGIAKTFNVTGKEIGDTAVGLQQRFGVLAKETIEFAADVGPAAKAAGLKYQEIAAIGAAFQRASGRSGSSGAEALGRILPTIEDNALTILQIFRELGDDKLTQKVADNLNQGKTGRILLQILQNYGRLSTTQRQSITEALGGRREAQTLNAIFGSYRDINKELDKIGSHRDTGRLNQQFEALQSTVAQSFAELKQTALQLGVALYQSGIAQSLTVIAKAATILLTSVLQLLTPLTELMGLLSQHGPAGNILAGGLLLGGLVAARRSLGARRSAAGAGAVTQGLGAESVLGSGLILPTGVSAENTGRSLGQRISTQVQTYRTALFENMNQVVALGLSGALVAGGLATGDTALAGVGLGIGLAATGNPLLGTITAATSIISGYLNNAKEAQQRSADLATQYQSLSGKQLHKIIRNSNQATGPTLPVFQGPSYAIAGAINGKDIVSGTTDEQAAIDEIARRRLTYEIRLLQAYLDQGPVEKVKKSIKKALREAKDTLAKGGGKNTRAAYEIANTEIGQIVSNFETNGLTYITRGAKVLESRAKSGRFNNTDSAKLTRTITESGKAFEAGTLSFAQYRTALEKARDTALLAINSSKGGEVPDSVVAAFQDATNRISKLVSDAIKSRVDILLKIRRAQGKDLGLDDLNILQGALANPDLTDPSTRSDILAQGIAALHEELQRRVDSAKTAAEKLAIESAGILVPDQLEQENVAEQIQNAINLSGQARDKMAILADSLGLEGVNGLIQAAAAEVIANGGTIKAALEKIINNEIAKLEGTLNLLLVAQGLDAFLSKEFNDAYNKIAGLRGTLEGVLGDSGLDVQPVQIDTIHLGNAGQLANQAADEAERAAEEARRAQKEYWDAIANYNKALVENDPIRVAQIDIENADRAIGLAETEAERINAEAEKIRAERALGEAIEAVIESQQNLAIAAAEGAGDNLQAIRLKLDQLRTELYLKAIGGYGEAELNRIRADIVAQEHALGNAMFSLIESQENILIAIAEAAGDSVEAARQRLQTLQENLYLQAIGGAGETELNSIRSNIIQQQAALRDAQLQEKLDTIDFNLEVERISKQQAVSQLEALLQSADILHLTEQQKRDLILKIRQLRQDLSRDLQFNLPSELRLPTLYEVRRLGQTAGNYQDNRTVNITLNSSGGLDGQAAVDQITNEVNSSSVYGTKPRRY